MFELCGRLSYEIFLVGTGVIIYYYSKFNSTGYSIIIIAILIFIIAFAINKLSSIIKMIFDWKGK